MTAFILKQLKGTGVHTLGAKSHNLYPADTLEPHIIEGLQRRALPPAAWALVRENFVRAGGGPAVKTAVTEFVLDLAPLAAFPCQEFTPGDKAVPATALGALAAWVGQQDPRFVVTNADGNEASAMKNINDALKIRHPTPDPLYNQGPTGQVYEPLNEDACAGLAAGLACSAPAALAVLRKLCHQRLAHRPDRDPGHGRTAPQDAVVRLHVHRRCLGAGPQRLDPPTPGDRKLFRRPDAQRQPLPAVSAGRQQHPGRLRVRHQ